MRKFLLAAIFTLLFCSIQGCLHEEVPPPPPPPPPPVSKSLSIYPVIQETTVWCWAAAAQMVLGYFGYPSINPISPQCGIVASFFGGQCAYDCTLCTTGIGPMSNEQYVINYYGPFINSYIYPYSYRPLSSVLIFRALSIDEISNEISNNRPIVVGIAPGGGWALPNASQHIAVLIGYDYSNGNHDVVVNDPYPFHLYSSQPNPYLLAGAMLLQPGQYKLSYSALVQQMYWANSIYSIHPI